MLRQFQCFPTFLFFVSMYFLYAPSAMAYKCAKGKRNHMGACYKCPKGTYQPQAKYKGKTCKKCPAGKYSGAGAASCKTCPGGSTSKAGSSSCVKSVGSGSKCGYKSGNVSYKCKSGHYCSWSRKCKKGTRSKTFAAALDKAFNDAKKWTKKAGKSIEAEGGKLWKKIGKPAGDFITKTAAKVAKPFQTDIGKRITGKVLGKGIGLALKLTSESFYKVNRAFLATITNEGTKNSEQLTKIYKSKETAYKASKNHLKTMAISASLALTMLTVRPWLRCAIYKNLAKKMCLHAEYGNSIRDLVFSSMTITAQTGLNVAFYEPTAHTVAGSVTAALAASTFGVGVMSYPGVYLASVLALNLTTIVAVEVLVRPEFEKWTLKKGLTLKAHKLAGSMVKVLPTTLKCSAMKKSNCTETLDSKHKPLNTEPWHK